jgi:XTP/dITP diphosphohydrolase
MAGELKRGDRIVIATHNRGKAKELAALFASVGVETVWAAELGIDEPEETGASFADNARIKAETAAKASGMPAVADDSGLEVTALGGAPGVHSARWGGPNRDFALAMERVNRELAATGSDDRRANFTCALALASPDGAVQIFEGRVFGIIVWPPRGTRGFGYDPIFVPEGHRETFGEMAPQEKDAISHRARAFAKLMQATDAGE